MMLKNSKLQELINSDICCRYLSGKTQLGSISGITHRAQVQTKEANAVTDRRLVEENARESLCDLGSRKTA